MKKLYTSLAGIFLISTSIFAQTLVASYPFNGNANDASGNGNNGTVNGATLTTDRFGNANSAYSFNGNSNFIQVANSASLQLGSHFTISAWSNLAAYNTTNYQGNLLLSKGTDVGDAMSFNLQVGEIDNNVNPDPNGYKRFIFFNNPTGVPPYAEVGDTILGPQIALNTWYYSVATVDGNVMKIFVNGSLIDTKTFAATLNGSNALDLFIGRQNLGGIAAYWWNGSLDDIKIYNGALTDEQVADSFSKQSLVASYPFNGNANDASGNGNNGTVNGATLTTDRFGNANSAYSFNGSGNYIQVPNSASLQLTTNYTISAWVKPVGFYSGQCQTNSIIVKGPFNGEGTFYLDYHDNDNNCNVLSSNSEIFFAQSYQGNTEYAVDDPTINIQLNTWYMVTSVRNGNQLSIYVNGQLKATTTISGTLGAVNSQPMTIGGDASNGAFPNWVNGVIDDIKIYNGALTDAQIFDTYVNDVKKPGSGNALQLYSTGSLATSPYVNIGSGFDFGSQPFTYETWLKRDTVETTLNNYGKVLIVGDLNNSWGVGILNDNTLAFTKVGVNFVASTSTIADTNWHHVAVVYTGTQIQFYIDGVAAGSPTYSDNFSNTSGSYLIGDRQSFGNSNGDQTLAGKIDETRIWKNVALTQTEIRDWMCKKVTSAHPAYNNLFAYFRFDEGSGTIANSVGGHPGILINSPTWVNSGASIGDASSYDYTNATKTATLGSPTGETFTVTSTIGNPAGIQVYRVDTLPNTLTGTIGTGGNHKYFGVFQSGGTSPLYSAVYNYGSYAAISGNDPTGFRLYRRHNNADVLWTDAVATLNTTNKILTVAGASTEYMLGSILYPLPLKLISFNAFKNGSDVVLNWQTTNEENLKNYVVEKSTDGTAFTQLTEVNANNNPGTNNYAAIDMNPVNGINYYRLKQIDLDGKYTYSNIASINFSDNLKVFISPNPATSNIKIYSDQMLKSVQILDMSGKTIKWLIPTSNNLYDISGLQKGIYFLRVTTETETRTLRLEKL